jgi:hypothetical protein
MAQAQRANQPLLVCVALASSPGGGLPASGAAADCITRTATIGQDLVSAYMNAPYLPVHSFVVQKTCRQMNKWEL